VLLFRAWPTRSGEFATEGQDTKMKATIRWLEDATFQTETGSGHTIVTDGPPESGGRNLGARPMEMMLVSVGSCSSFDVMSILRKSRQDVTSCEAEVSAIRADAIPAVFETIHIHFKVAGNNLSEKHVERAINLSAEKYCSATIMLVQAGVKVTHDFEIVEGV
jgi:putative redox protein